MADIKVRVGQQNAVKVIASNVGIGNIINTSFNVIGGVGDIATLNVSGIATFQNNVSIEGTLVAGLIDGGSF